MVPFRVLHNEVFTLFLVQELQASENIKKDRLTTWAKPTRMFYTSLYREIQAPIIAHD